MRLTEHTRAVAAQPYPWPYHGCPDTRRTALLFFSGDGGQAVPKPLVTRWAALAESFREAGGTVGLLPASAWPQTSPQRLPVDFVVQRPHFGAFTGSDIDAVLRSRRLTDLVFVGVPFELGADCTMREANDLGYECLALSDVSAGLSPETFTAALRSVQMSGGIFGAVASSRELLLALGLAQSDFAA